MKKLLTASFAFLIILTLSVTAFASGGDVASEEANVFEIAYEWACENSAEILSALTFVGSLILAFTYKKVLLPKLSGALTKIGGSVNDLTEETEKSIKNIEGEFEAMKKKSEENEKLCLSLNESFNALSEKLDGISEDACERDKFKLINICMIFDFDLRS